MDKNIPEQSLLKAILNSTADAVLVTNMDGVVTLANETLCRWFDLDREAVIERPLEEIGLPDVLRQDVRRAMVRRHPGPTTFEQPLDDERYVVYHVSAAVNGDGDMHGWVIVLQDVTHRKAMERLKSRVMHSAAHDLLNPLHVTESSLNMLRRHPGDLRGPQAEMVDLAHRGLKRMRALIDDMLQLEQIEEGVGIVYEPTDLGKIIAEVAEAHQEAAGAKSLALAVNLPDELPSVQGDSKLLQRALSNLVDNALKYTPERGHVSIRATRNDNAVFVEVEDDGHGVSADAQSRLFERYYRVMAAEDDDPGTGLGLAIVKAVVERHGGQVWVRSQTGAGSTLGFSVPFAE